MAIQTAVKTKRCTGCGIEKPVSEFYEKDNHLRCECKVCYISRVKDYRKRRPSVTAIPPVAIPPVAIVRVGIDAYVQIGSVLRSIAEQQARVDDEVLLHKQRVAREKEAHKETIGALKTQIRYFCQMLAKYFRKNPDGPQSAKCRFGSVKLCDGKLGLELKPKLAKQMLGKP